MLTVTAAAIENLKGYMAQNKISTPIRVTIQRSCSGMGLALALDEKKTDDKVFEEDGITFVIDGDVLSSTGKITVDYLKSSGCGCSGDGGFNITSEKKLTSSAGGCGGSCSSGCSC
ncbi:MAG: hypothetical protein BWK76_12100 [Desulfobulbaceae bacterium A2]|nr:MAG: hypothetical protein BWK76_12100 [Desulfobulbaceae bacterium A2]